jgi:hypothetical protein
MDKPKEPAGMAKWNKKNHFDVDISVAISDTPSKHKPFGGDAEIRITHRGWKSFANGPTTKVACEDSVKALAKELRTGYGRQHMLQITRDYEAALKAKDQAAIKKLIAQGQKVTTTFKKTAAESLEAVISNYYKAQVLKPYEAERDRRKVELERYKKDCETYKKHCEAMAAQAKVLRNKLGETFKKERQDATKGRGMLDKAVAAVKLARNGIPSVKPLVTALQGAKARIASDWTSFSATYLEYIKAKTQYEKAKPEAKAVYEGMMEGAKQTADTDYFKLVVNTKNRLNECSAALAAFCKKCQDVVGRVDTLFNLKKELETKLNHHQAFLATLQSAAKSADALKLRATSYETQFNALLTSSVLKESLDKVTKAGVDDYLKTGAAMEAAIAKLVELSEVLEALDPKAELLNLADVLSQGPDAVDAWAKTYEAKLKEEAERVEQTARELALAVFESNTANALWAALMS